MAVQILPSLLAADYGALAADITRAFRSGADALHLDIMDAHFVPNLSFGPDIVKLCRRVEPEFYRHVHLMMTRPDLYLEVFANAGAQTRASARSACVRPSCSIPRRPWRPSTPISPSATRYS